VEGTAGIRSALGLESVAEHGGRVKECPWRRACRGMDDHDDDV
jgi:hypothetical protein